MPSPYRDTPLTATADILIIGYGPTGAVLAGLLGGRGYHVIVADQSETIYDKPRAITADHEALRVFQEIGVADEVYETSSPHPGTDFVGCRDQIIKRFYPAAPPNPLGWTQSFMFVQPELETILRRAVKNSGSVTELLGHQLLHLTQSDDGVAAKLSRLNDGCNVQVKARYLVGADGAASTVRKQFAPVIEDLAFDEHWIVVDTWIKGQISLPPRLVQYCRPQRPGTYIAGPGTLRRWEIKILPHENPEEFRDPARVWTLLSEFVDTTALEHWRTAIYRFHALVAQSWRFGRVFLAGDAAHQMPPFMGQGLCAGIRDAFNLAWKLDFALQGRATEQLLASYTEERKRHVRQVVGHAKEFGLIIGELDPKLARERDARLEADLAAGRVETVRQRFIPGLEMGLIHFTSEGLPAHGAGELFLQPWIKAVKSRWVRLDDMVGPRFVLAVVDGEVLTNCSSATWSRWHDLDGCVVSLAGRRPAAILEVAWFDVSERDGLLMRWFADRGCTALIARPDRYVYGTADSAEAISELIKELHSAVLVKDAASLAVGLSSP